MIKPIDPRPLLALRRRLISEIPPLEQIVRGSLMRYALRCSHPRCRCQHRTKDLRHGPYWYLVVHRGKGKQKLYAIPKGELPSIHKGKKAYETLWKNLMEISEINVLLLKARNQGGRNAIRSTKS